MLAGYPSRWRNDGRRLTLWASILGCRLCPSRARLSSARAWQIGFSFANKPQKIFGPKCLRSRLASNRLPSIEGNSNRMPTSAPGVGSGFESQPTQAIKSLCNPHQQRLHWRSSPFSPLRTDAAGNARKRMISGKYLTIASTRAFATAGNRGLTFDCGYGSRPVRRSLQGLAIEESFQEKSPTKEGAFSLAPPP